MNFLNRCNGYSIPCPSMSPQAAFKLHTVLVKAREDFKAFVAKNRGDYEFGWRFYSDKSVEERIMAAATEEEFVADAEAWALDALRDCAGADYWYTYEKNWD